MATALGVVAGYLGIIGFVEKHLPQPVGPHVANTNSRIYVGIGPEDSTLGGNVPKITLWDIHGMYMGQNNTSYKVGNGGFFDSEIEHTHKAGNRRPDYVMISKDGIDALCIASVGLTFPDGEKQTWLGDIGARCGMPWYPSEMPIGNEGEHPDCVWIDGDHSYGELPMKAFSFHIQDFIASEARARQYEEHIDTMCRAPRFQTYKDLKDLDRIDVYDPILSYNKDLTDVNLDNIKSPNVKKSDKTKHDFKRQVDDAVAFAENMVHTVLKGNGPARSTWVNERLVIAKYNATYLCNDPYSWGPDMLDKEGGVFCDMTNKQIFPVCSGSGSESAIGCFDEIPKRIRPSDVKGVHIPVKTYKSVRDWTKNQA